MTNVEPQTQGEFILTHRLISTDPYWMPTRKMGGRAEKASLGGASLEERKWPPLLWEMNFEKCWALGTEKKHCLDPCSV